MYYENEHPATRKENCHIYSVITLYTRPFSFWATICTKMTKYWMSFNSIAIFLMNHNVHFFNNSMFYCCKNLNNYKLSNNKLKITSQISLGLSYG